MEGWSGNRKRKREREKVNRKGANKNVSEAHAQTDLFILQVPKVRDDEPRNKRCLFRCYLLVVMLMMLMMPLTLFSPTVGGRGQAG